jgi:uncharacterized repeat protein (TIGR03803 family)
MRPGAILEGFSLDSPRKIAKNHDTMRKAPSILSHFLLWMHRTEDIQTRILLFRHPKVSLFMAMALLIGPFHADAGPVCTWIYSLDSYCDSTLMQDTNGLLIGTTVGPSSVLYPYGTIFSASTNVVLPPPTRGPASTIYGFKIPTGGKPEAGTILVSDGTSKLIFGTAAYLGASNTLFPTGMGSVYNTAGLSLPNPTVYHFGKVLNSKGQPLDGANPRSTLVAGADGFVYGTTYEGGSNGYSGNGLGYGTVFRLASLSLDLTSLHSFTGADGANPTGLTFGSDGNLYGVASFGGSNTTVVQTNGKTGFGTIYKITTNGDLTVLYSFGTLTNSAGNALDGCEPNPLLQGSDGNFYGTTTYGGSNTTVVDTTNDIGYGTFFQLSTNGVFTLLYSFGSITNSDGVPLDGASPSGPLAEGLDGNFYGVTQYGGPTNTGTVYRMTPQGLLTTLYTCGTNRAHTDPPPPPSRFRRAFIRAADC